MSGSVLGQIRATCAEVAARARFVAIDPVRLRGLARTLPTDGPADAGEEFRYVGTDADIAAFVVTLDAVNFGSGWWPHVRKLPGLSGYFTMATHLRRAYTARGPLAPEALVELTGPDCARLFGQVEHGLPGELMEHYAGSLRDLGHLVQQRFGGLRVVGARGRRLG